ASLTLNLSLTGGTGPLQGTASVDIGTAAGNGTATFTNLRIDAASAGQQLTASASGLTSALSAVFTVNAGPAASLAIQTQPPTTVSAGVTFSPAPAIRILDAFGNLRSGDSSTVVTVARSAGSGTLQGTLTATAANGVATFANLSHNLATTISLNFTASGVGGATSGNIVVSPAAFAKLQQLVPGEIAAPGTATGKTGTPTERTADTAFNVTVNAVDACWNLVSSTHTVGITATDPNDTNPANAALSAGTRTFALTFKSAGSWTVTATDITDGTKTANTSPSITATAGAFTKLQILL